MCPLSKYPVLQSLLKPFRRSQQKTLAWAVAGIIETAQVRSLLLAAHLAVVCSIQVGSALNRFYRLLRNPRISDETLTQQLLILLRAQEERVLIGVDWTMWHSGWQMLVAAVAKGTRALPVLARTVRTAALESSQNAEEEAFLETLVKALKAAGVFAVLLFDRGFRRVDWLKALQAALEEEGEKAGGFVVRLMDDVMVHKKGQKMRRLREIPLREGQRLDLGWVWVRQDEAVCVRVVGVWAHGQQEGWWLATNLDTPVMELAGYYDRRMAIEEQFRDSKGSRFGLQMEWTQFRTPEYLSRLTLLVGIAMAIWTAVGAAVAQKEPTVQMPCKHKGARLSVLRVGMGYIQCVARQVWVGIEYVRQHLPPVRIRRFKRLKRLTIHAAFA